MSVLKGCRVTCWVMSLDALKQKPNWRGMVHEVKRSKEMGGDRRNQHAKDPAQRRKWKNNERGSEGKWKDRR